MRKAAFTLAVLMIIGIAAAPPATATTWPKYRMAPSDRTVLPGQVVTVTVEGPGVERWMGGMDSYFERRRRDGSWQRLYMLVWYGYRPPSVASPNSGILDIGVEASPFHAVIPAVRPGVYRITRRFLTEPGFNPDERTLSARVTVKACPKGQRPTFTPPTGYQYDYGAPGCELRK